MALRCNHDPVEPAMHRSICRRCRLVIENEDFFRGFQLWVIPMETVSNRAIQPSAEVSPMSRRKRAKSAGQVQRKVRRG